MQPDHKDKGLHFSRLATRLSFYLPSSPVHILFLALCIAGCSTNPQPGMLIDRIKNRGPINISTSNPYLVANQFLDYHRKHSVDIKQFLNSRGAPGALEIQKPLFEEAQIYLYYPENGQYYVLTEGIENWTITGPFKLSGRKMYQVHDVVQGIPVNTR